MATLRTDRAHADVCHAWRCHDPGAYHRDSMLPEMLPLIGTITCCSGAYGRMKIMEKLGKFYWLDFQEDSLIIILPN